jgi:hypothetical protein
MAIGDRDFKILTATVLGPKCSHGVKRLKLFKINIFTAIAQAHSTAILDQS